MSMQRARGLEQQGLARRINRFLDRLEAEGRNPNRLEGDLLLNALSHLAALQLRVVEEAMNRAEQAETAAPEVIASIRPSLDPLTTSSLRSALERVLDRSASFEWTGGHQRRH